MKAFLALLKREYLEHRGAFLYGPLILLGLLVLGTSLPFLAGRFRADYFGEQINGTLVYYQFAFMAAIAGWAFYLVITLFFYYGDAFFADKKNNAMLFWKSMPQSDLKILTSKMVAGLTVFPALIFAAILFSGVWAYVMALMAHAQFPAFVLPSIGDIVDAYWRVGLAGLIALVFMLLWVAPFFAWVGALATGLGRWAMPVAVLIPVVLIVLENVLFKSPGGGVIANYMRHRGDLEWMRPAVQNQLLAAGHVDVVRFASDIVGNLDWTAMLTGWVFVAIAVFAASEYRRRTLD